MLLNLIFTEKPYINETIQNNSNKPFEQNPDLSKFNINICHLCNKKLIIFLLKIIVITVVKCWDMHIMNVI